MSFLTPAPLPLVGAALASLQLLAPACVQPDVDEPCLDCGSDDPVQVGLSRNPQGPGMCWVDADGDLGCWPPALAQRPGFPDRGGYDTVSVGDGHLCVLDLDGGVECWGWGTCEFGQCESPEGTFLQIRVGTTVNCAERLDHTVLCWGQEAEL